MRLPEGVVAYAVGDIHGRVDLLADVFAKIDEDRRRQAPARAIEVYLGDYIDRGPASRDAISALVERSQGRETAFVLGNHERFALDFLRDPSTLAQWRQFGGLETLVSYGLRPSLGMSSGDAEMTALAQAFATALPAAHRAFLDGLRPIFVLGGVVFVHAGIDPRRPISEQREEDLLLMREPFLSYRGELPAFVVHGHTPVPAPDIRENRLNLDTGAYATGRLTCARLNAAGITIL